LFTQFLKHSAGATYLDSFFVFQGFGFFGLMLLMRLFQEIEMAMNTRASRLSTYLLFLPSLHFWTSAIGKDAPLFFAICLCAWAVMRIRRRWIVFCAGIFLMVLFRAHIALITMMSVALAAATHGRFTAGRRLALLTIAAVGAVILTGAVNSTLKLDITSSGSLSSFFAERDQIAAASSGSTTIGDAGYPMRLISLLFRPFFIDVSGFLGFVPSAENVGSVLLFGYMIIKWQQLRWLTKRVFFMRYALSFTIILVLLLASVNYNLGLGIRQRVMALPTLLSILVAMWGMRQHRFGAPLNQYGAKLLSRVPANKSVTESP
jgi:hypothetical protein